MYALLMVLFIILCFFLAFAVLIQQGKGDLGIGSLGSQMLFGGSGGQTIFEKATWIMGALFIFGALGLAILKSKEHRASILEGATMPQVAHKAPGHASSIPTNQAGQTANVVIDKNITTQSTQDVTPSTGELQKTT